MAGTKESTGRERSEKHDVGSLGGAKAEYKQARQKQPSGTLK